MRFCVDAVLLCVILFICYNYYVVDTMPGPEFPQSKDPMKNTGKTPEDARRDIEALKVHGVSESRARILGVMQELIDMQKTGKDGMEYTDSQGREGHVNFSNPDVIPLLTDRAHVTNPEVILELGTAHGLGTLSMLYGAPHAEAITVEFQPEVAEAARQNFEKAGLKAQVVKVGEDFDSLGKGSVTILQGDASAAIDPLPSRYQGRIGLVYIDHPKEAYAGDLQKIEANGLLPKGAIVIADNTVSHLLREGTERHHQGIRNYLRLVEAASENPTHWKTYTSPSYDGSTISQKL